MINFVNDKDLWFTFGRELMSLVNEFKKKKKAGSYTGLHLMRQIIRQECIIIKYKQARIAEQAHSFRWGRWF